MDRKPEALSFLHKSYNDQLKEISAPLSRLFNWYSRSSITSWTLSTFDHVQGRKQTLYQFEVEPHLLVMKSQILLTSILASTALTASLNTRATRATGVVTEDEIIDTLLRQDAFLLPKNSACI